MGIEWLEGMLPGVDDLKDDVFSSWDDEGRSGVFVLVTEPGCSTGHIASSICPNSMNQYTGSSNCVRFPRLMVALGQMRFP